MFVLQAGRSAVNSIDDYEVHFKDHNGDDRVTDVPSPVIYAKVDGSWSVKVWEYRPGPGPGDFDMEFPSESAAVDDVIRYFFDDHPKFLEYKQADD